MGHIMSCSDFILSSFQETEYIHIVVFMLQADNQIPHQTL
jgi:hypothetical protein